MVSFDILFIDFNNIFQGRIKNSGHFHKVLLSSFLFIYFFIYMTSMSKSSNITVWLKKKIYIYFFSMCLFSPSLIILKSDILSIYAQRKWLFPDHVILIDFCNRSNGVEWCCCADAARSFTGVQRLVHW